MVKTFDELWKDIEERAQRWAIPIVQDRTELEYIFNLIKNCKSYLEIGTAEGNGLYVLSHALDDNAVVATIDFGEKHTRAASNEALSRINKEIIVNDGNSHNINVSSKMLNRKFEVVFIDAGHKYEDVIADAMVYGSLATKYVIFHDIQLPEVRSAYNWWIYHNPQFRHHEFINSKEYGYGIIEV